MGECLDLGEWLDCDSRVFLEVIALPANIQDPMDSRSWKGPQSSRTCCPSPPLHGPPSLLSSTSGDTYPVVLDTECGRDSLSSSCGSSVALSSSDRLLEELPRGSCCPIRVVPRVNARETGLQPPCRLSREPPAKAILNEPNCA